eukprot:TRINITY_DN5416_c0_g1_i1.p2 TRINITY_DN5416_c0_g1~~TRINITY_DN5416_c0_g1_i1.p2  ORF type:complete len:117 (-),score=27.22 TRINITY_DN5416_c0_g1_i1:134-484(-)
MFVIEADVDHITRILECDNFFDVLKVPREDVSFINKHYRKLSMAVHPDKNPDNPQAQEAFQKLAKAYACLSDEQSKSMYIRYGIESATPEMMQKAAEIEEETRQQIVNWFMNTFSS